MTPGMTMFKMIVLFNILTSLAVPSAVALLAPQKRLPSTHVLRTKCDHSRLYALVACLLAGFVHRLSHKIGACEPPVQHKGTVEGQRHILWNPVFSQQPGASPSGTRRHVEQRSSVAEAECSCCRALSWNGCKAHLPFQTEGYRGHSSQPSRPACVLWRQETHNGQDQTSCCHASFQA